MEMASQISKKSSHTLGMKQVKSQLSPLFFDLVPVIFAQTKEIPSEFFSTEANFIRASLNQMFEIVLSDGDSAPGGNPRLIKLRRRVTILKKSLITESKLKEKKTIDDLIKGMQMCGI